MGVLWVFPLDGAFSRNPRTGVFELDSFSNALVFSMRAFLAV